MLRAKQINALSNGARIFFISSSRCSAADGSACTCSADETCISKTQYTKNEKFQTQKPTALPYTTLDKVGKLVPGNSANVLHCRNTTSVDKPSSITQALEVVSSPSQCDTGTYDRDRTMVSHLPPLNADQFFKAGIAVVNFLSDMVNHKLPIPVGNGAFNYSSNCMVDPTRSVPNIRSSNVKHIKGDNFSSLHPKTICAGCIRAKPQQ